MKNFKKKSENNYQQTLKDNLIKIASQISIVIDRIELDEEKNGKEKLELKVEINMLKKEIDILLDDIINNEKDNWDWEKEVTNLKANNYRIQKQIDNLNKIIFE